MMNLIWVSLNQWHTHTYARTHTHTRTHAHTHTRTHAHTHTHSLSITHTHSHWHTHTLSELHIIDWLCLLLSVLMCYRWPLTSRTVRRLRLSNRRRDVNTENLQRKTISEFNKGFFIIQLFLFESRVTHIHCMEKYKRLSVFYMQCWEGYFGNVIGSVTFQLLY